MLRKKEEKKKNFVWSSASHIIQEDNHRSLIVPQKESHVIWQKDSRTDSMKINAT